jgi:endonuclease I
MGQAKNTKLKGKFFEPIDEFKGDLARGYFYLLTAYYDKVQDWRSPILTGNNFSSIYRIFTKLGHMIPLWKGKNPIYFGSLGQGHWYYK